MSSYDLERARSYFSFDKGVTYLNHAAHSPLTIPAREAFETFFDSWQKTAHNHDAESFRIFEELRGKLAALIGTEPARIGLAPHTTFGMNVLASGLGWNKGDNLVLSENEFPAGVYPWLRLRDEGVEIRFAKTQNGFIDENALISATDEKTRVIHVSWVQFNNGNRVDMARLGSFCEEYEILFSVDGIQGTGAIPIDVPAAMIDLFTCGCQKWMLGPCGTGFYYLSERAEDRIEPPYSGWLSVDWHADFGNLMRYDLLPRQGPARYEIGTYAFQDWRALNASIDILLSFDGNQIWEHICSLTEKLMTFIQSDPDLRLISPKDKNRRSGIVTFKSSDSKSLYDKLTAAGFVVSFRENAIRVSPHFYNTPEEIDRFTESIRSST
jgi:cysteine desulfurase/selenocysteine lyase